MLYSERSWQFEKSSLGWNFCLGHVAFCWPGFRQHNKSSKPLNFTRVLKLIEQNTPIQSIYSSLSLHILHFEKVTRCSVLGMSSGCVAFVCIHLFFHGRFLIFFSSLPALSKTAAIELCQSVTVTRRKEAFFPSINLSFIFYYRNVFIAQELVKWIMTYWTKLTCLVWTSWNLSKSYCNVIEIQ